MIALFRRFIQSVTHNTPLCRSCKLSRDEWLCITYSDCSNCRSVDWQPPKFSTGSHESASAPNPAHLQTTSHRNPSLQLHASTERASAVECNAVSVGRVHIIPNFVKRFGFTVWQRYEFLFEYLFDAMDRCVFSVFALRFGNSRSGRFHITILLIVRCVASCLSLSTATKQQRT